MSAQAGASADVILGMQIGVLMQDVELIVARKALGMSQVALAEILGIHPTILNRWERGRAKIPPYLHWALYGITAAKVNRESLAILNRE